MTCYHSRFLRALSSHLEGEGSYVRNTAVAYKSHDMDRHEQQNPQILRLLQSC